MTSHHDVADSVAWLRQPRWIEGSFQKKLFDIADLLESQAKALSEAESDLLNERRVVTIQSEARVAAEARLIQIEAVCTDNKADNCRHQLALRFIKKIAARAQQESKDA